MTEYTLIPCPSCSHEMSVDAEACPQCGGANNWVHPTLEKVIAYVDTLPRVTQFEALGHRMNLYSQHKNLRQKIGGGCITAAMGLLVLGMFNGTFLVLAMLSLSVGGALTLFGLSWVTHHELTIDLRDGRKITGVTDERFWADVIRMVV